MTDDEGQTKCSNFDILETSCYQPYISNLFIVGCKKNSRKIYVFVRIILKFIVKKYLLVHFYY